MGTVNDMPKENSKYIHLDGKRASRMAILVVLDAICIALAYFLRVYLLRFSSSYFLMR